MRVASFDSVEFISTEGKSPTDQIPALSARLSLLIARGLPEIFAAFGKGAIERRRGRSDEPIR